MWQSKSWAKKRQLHDYLIRNAYLLHENILINIYVSTSGIGMSMLKYYYFMIQNSTYSPCNTQIHLWAQNLKGIMITVFVHLCCIWTLNVIRGCQMKITSESPAFHPHTFLTWQTLISTDMVIFLTIIATIITLTCADTATASTPLRKTTTQPGSQVYWLWLFFEAVEWCGCGGAILRGANRGRGGGSILSTAALDERDQVEDEPTEHNEKTWHHKGHHIVTSCVCNEPCGKNNSLTPTLLRLHAVVLLRKAVHLYENFMKHCKNKLFVWVCSVCK